MGKPCLKKKKKEKEKKEKEKLNAMVSIKRTYNHSEFLSLGDKTYRVISHEFEGTHYGSMLLHRLGNSPAH